MLPDQETFGYLVLASVASIYIGSGFYSIYAVRNWGGTKMPPETDKDEKFTSEDKKLNAAPASYGATDDVERTRL